MYNLGLGQSVFQTNLTGLKKLNADQILEKQLLYQVEFQIKYYRL